MSSPPAVVGRFLETFAHVVGLEDGDATRSQVFERRSHRRTQVRLARHIADRVVDEDRVEGATEPKRPHVADQVLDARVDRLTQLDHVGRQIGQRHLHLAPQERRHVAATRPEFKERLERTIDMITQEFEDRPRLSGVLLGWCQQMEPRGQLAVHGHGLRVHAYSVARERPPRSPGGSGVSLLASEDADRHPRHHGEPWRPVYRRVQHAHTQLEHVPSRFRLSSPSSSSAEQFSDQRCSQPTLVAFHSPTPLHDECPVDLGNGQCHVEVQGAGP